MAQSNFPKNNNTFAKFYQNTNVQYGHPQRPSQRIRLQPLLQAPQPSNANSSVTNTTSTHNTLHRGKPAPNDHVFTSGIVDFVSYNYDAHRLKNPDFHQNFAKHLGQKIGEKINKKSQFRVDCTKKDLPARILLAPLRRRASQIHCGMDKPPQSLHDNVLDYAQYNIFENSSSKTSDKNSNNNHNTKHSNHALMDALFHPSYWHGIRDINLFRYVSKYVLRLVCVGDVGIDILNFLHSLFITLYWNDYNLSLQRDGNSMKGMLKMMLGLVPLQTCVWWLHLHRSLNMVNGHPFWPCIDFKNILNNEKERNKFYLNFIQRMMQHAQDQIKRWKTHIHLQHTRNCQQKPNANISDSINAVLANEKSRRMQQSAFATADKSLNQQLNHYVDQLLLPKFIIAAKLHTRQVQHQLISQHFLNPHVLQARRSLHPNNSRRTNGYFEDHRDILQGTYNMNTAVDNQKEEEDGLDKAAKLAMNNLLQQTRRNSVSKQPQKSGSATPRNPSSSLKQEKGDSEESESERDSKAKRKRKREREEDPDWNPCEKPQKERRGRKRKSVDSSSNHQHTVGAPAKKRARKQSVMSQSEKNTNGNSAEKVKQQMAEFKQFQEDEVSSEEDEDEVVVELTKDGKVAIDLSRKRVSGFLKCGLCHGLLSGEVMTMECMHSFCAKCLDEYLTKCQRENARPSCSICKQAFGQGSIDAIRRRCQEDKVKTSLLTLIANSLPSPS